VGFEPTIPEFERAKTFNALDRAATVIGMLLIDLIFGKSDGYHFVTGANIAKKDKTAKLQKLSPHLLDKGKLAPVPISPSLI
jgi:hypothetical protein